MATLVSDIRSLSAPVDSAAVAAQVRAYLDKTYPDLASLNPSSKSKRASWSTRRTLDEDIVHWEKSEADSRARLAEAEAALPGAIAAAEAALGEILDRAQRVSLQRYALSDAVTALLAELSSTAPQAEAFEDDEDIWGGDEERKTPAQRAQTLLEKVEATHAALARSEAALAWGSVLERILNMR
jgi:hypothetical protein